jgi:hypothetical protein
LYKVWRYSYWNTTCLGCCKLTLLLEITFTIKNWFNCALCVPSVIPFPLSPTSSVASSLSLNSANIRANVRFTSREPFTTIRCYSISHSSRLELVRNGSCVSDSLMYKTHFPIE